MSKERYRRAVKESRSLQWWDKTYTDNLRESYRSELKQESEYYMREVKELRSPDQEPIMKADLFSAPLLKASLARALRRGLEDRLRKREIINNCTVSIIVPDCYFFGVMWPVLERDAEAAVAQRHVGLWDTPKYYHKALFEVCSESVILEIFGHNVLEPVKWGALNKLSNYNDDPSNGPLRGGRSRVKVSESSPIILSVRIMI